MDFLRSAFILSLGSFLSKVLGALYRFPLLRLIGTQEMGKYQMIYPVYALLLTVSSVGLPSSLSYLVASGKNCMPTARRIFRPIGFCLSVLLCLVSYPLALLQGRTELVWGYLAISPSVYLVTELSLMRGEFQGHGRMVPTALSQLVEQVVKIGFGLLFSYFLSRPFIWLLLSVTIGEGASLACLLCFRQDKEEGEAITRKQLIMRTLPVTFSACILPLSSFVDSILLTKWTGISSFGLFSGCVSPLIALSSSVCVGISGAVIPRFAKGEREIGQAVFLTILCSSLVLFSLLMGRESVATILYGLKEEKEVFLRLLLLSLPSCIFLPLVQTMAGCLTGRGRAEISAYCLLMGSVVKLLAECILVPKIGIYGGAISADLCYLVAFFLELLYSIVYKENDHVDYRGLRCSGRGLIRTCKRSHLKR